MKIAIISDSHDNLPNIEKAIFDIKREGCHSLIHCGDIVSPETIKEILMTFRKNVYFSLGNADKDYLRGLPHHFLEQSLADFSNFRIFEDFGEIRAGGRKICFGHMPQQAREMAFSQKCDIVFYGHSHKPQEGKIGRTRLVNPGNIAGLIFKASFAIYDTERDKLVLRIL